MTAGRHELWFKGQIELRDPLASKFRAQHASYHLHEPPIFTVKKCTLWNMMYILIY